MLQEIVSWWPFGRDSADILYGESLKNSNEIRQCSEHSGPRELTGGACVNTLYSWPNHSSSSRIEATFPHLSHVLLSIRSRSAQG